jgi:regulator of sigma E protease
VERNGKIITLTVVPKYDPTLKRNILGIKAPIEYEEVRLSPLEALKRAIDRTWFLAVLTVKVIWGLITAGLNRPSRGRTAPKGRTPTQRQEVKG